VTIVRLNSGLNIDIFTDFIRHSFISPLQTHAVCEFLVNSSGSWRILSHKRVFH